MKTTIKEIIHTINPKTEFEVITLLELQAMLQESKGAKFVGLTTITEPDLIANCPFKNDCIKVSYFSGIVNWNYQNSVNNQREREGKETDFEAKPRKWGTRLKDSPFVSHVLKSGEHKLYLEVKIERSLDHYYYQLSTQSLYQESVIKPFLREKKESNQGTEKEIILRDYWVKNIAIISINGTNYAIKENT